MNRGRLYTVKFEGAVARGRGSYLRRPRRYLAEKGRWATLRWRKGQR